MDDSEDRCVNPVAGQTQTMATLIEERLNRRSFLRTVALAGGWLAASACAPRPLARGIAGSPETGRFGFEEIKRATDATHHVPPGYQADLLLRWGDPLFPDSAGFRSAGANRRGATSAIRLQQRFHWLPAAAARARSTGARTAVCQP